MPRRMFVWATTKGKRSMADTWNVIFVLGWRMTQEQMDEVMKQIPRSDARSAADDCTIVGVRQGAPTSMDAINRVGGRLRTILDRSKLGVKTVRARPYGGGE